jgi:flagellar biosynthesis/type III secretory pathway chaperone
MEQNVKQLKAILTQQSTIHDELNKAADMMLQALKRRDVEQIQQLTATYDQFSEQIAELEEKRLAVCDSLAKIFGDSGTHLTLAMIIERLDNPAAAELAQIRTGLKAKIRRLSRLTQINQILLQDGLQGAAVSFELYAHATKRFLNYKQGGKKLLDQTSRALFNKTV